MTSQEADRIIVEFARLTNANRILVVGSQAFYSTFPDASMDVVEGSREIDLIPLPWEDFERWYFYAHERLGADSEFDLENGFYADIVKPTVPKLPAGWENASLISKLLANRDQDIAFLRGVSKLQHLDIALLRTRLEAVELPADQKHRRAWALKAIAGLATASGSE